MNGTATDGMNFSMAGKFSFLLSLPHHTQYMNRHSTSPKVRREVVRNSNADVSDDEINSDAELDPPPRPAKKTIIPETHLVAEPKHKAAKKFRAKTAASVSGVGDFLKQRVELDERKLERDEKRDKTLQGISQERLNLERQRENQLEREYGMQHRLTMASKLLEMPGTGSELRKAAEDYLINLFK
jgi:hypothetical protein